MIVRIRNEPALQNPRRMTTHRRALAGMLLAMCLTLIPAGTAEARSARPPMAEPASTSIPDTAGHQLRWFLEEAKSLPIPVPAIEEHFSADLLAQLPPDQLNLYLDQSGYSTLVFLRVGSTTETSIVAAVDPGTGGPPVFLSLFLDADGRIADFTLSLFIPSRRAPSAGWPRCRCPVPRVGLPWGPRPSS